MSEPTKHGVTIGAGDKAVDRSETHVDNSSRVTKIVDDHSVRTSSVDDHSVRTTNMTDNSSKTKTVTIDASDNRRKSHVSINGGMLLGVVAILVVAVVAIVVVVDRPHGGSVPGSAPAPSIQATQGATPPLSGAGNPLAKSDGPAPAEPTAHGVIASKPVNARSTGGASQVAATRPARAAAEANEDFIDVDASGQPQDGLARGSREAYEDAVETAMLLAKAHFLAWRRGEITQVREIAGIKTIKADTMLMVKGQARGGRTMSQSSIEEFQTTGVVHIKVRFAVSADVTPKLER